jgi:hypothetical protein
MSNFPGLEPDMALGAWRDSVPAHLQKLCRLWPEGPVVFLESMTDVSVEGLIQLARMGFPLVIAPSETLDLHSLGSALAMFSKVRFLSAGVSVSGWDALENALALESLDLDGVASKIRLDQLPTLRSVTGVGRYTLSAALNPNLRNLGIVAPRLPTDFVVVSPLEGLAVMSREVRDLSFVSDPSELVTIVITGSRSFDLTAIAGLPKLRRLVLLNCLELLGARALLAIPHLDELEIVGTKSARGYEALVDLRANRIRIQNNYVFDDDFQLRVGGNSGWKFSRYKGGVDNRLGKSSLSNLVMGIDATTCAPFELSQLLDGSFEIRFDDWASLTESLGQSSESLGGSNLVDGIARAIILEDAPAALADGSVVFDSESEVVRIIATDLTTANEVGRILALAWTDTSRLLQLVLSCARVSPERGVD